MSVRLSSSAMLSFSSLLSISQVTSDDLSMLYERVREQDRIPTGSLSRHSASLFFLESSTRTQSSFWKAGGELGLTMVSVNDGTVEKKGEHPHDAFRVLDSMDFALHIIRCPDHELIEYAGSFQTPVINAGSGAREHPTQALLDWLTLRESLGELSGKSILFIGDQRYSRVFGSTAPLLASTGMDLHALCPPSLQHSGLIHELSITPQTSLDSALQAVDAVYVLRPQFERGTADQLSPEAYASELCLTLSHLTSLSHSPSLLHALPYNRDMDLSFEAAHHYDHSLLWKQVHNGVRMRRALLSLMLGS